MKTPLLIALVIFPLHGICDTANNVELYTDAKIAAAGKQLAEAVSRMAPAQIDSITLLEGAIFVPQTKTFIYKYRTIQALDATAMKPYITRQTCGDPIRKAFMHKGMSFLHQYDTPTGQKTTTITYKDCQ